MTDNTNVLDFRVRLLSVKRKDDEPGTKEYYCDHFNVLISTKNRTLECDHCGVDVDPYHWIGRLAGKESGAYFELRKQICAGRSLDEFVFKNDGVATISKNTVKATMRRGKQQLSATSSTRSLGDDTSTCLDRLLRAIDSVKLKAERPTLRTV